MELVRQTRAAEESIEELMRRDHAAESLRRTIRGEIKTLGNHEWAGEYYEGSGTGVNISLMLAPKSGFVFEWHGCTSLYDLNQGQVNDAGGKLGITFTYPKDRDGLRGLADELIPVAWGPRRYIIPTDEMVEFCNAVNGGIEPRDGLHGMYLLRCGDESKKVVGLPAVPSDFKRYLLTTPIEAEIIEVKTRAGKKTTVRLNRGKKDGLLPGMELHVVQPDSVHLHSAKITTPEDETSEAIMTRILSRGPEPRVGWKLSTRFPWHTDAD